MVCGKEIKTIEKENIYDENLRTEVGCYQGQKWDDIKAITLVWIFQEALWTARWALYLPGGISFLLNNTKAFLSL